MEQSRALIKLSTASCCDAHSRLPVAVPHLRSLRLRRSLARCESAAAAAARAPLAKPRLPPQHALPVGRHRAAHAPNQGRQPLQRPQAHLQGSGYRRQGNHRHGPRNLPAPRGAAVCTGSLHQAQHSHGALAWDEMH